MTFWTFLFLFSLLVVFFIAQLVKLLNSDTKAGDLARALAASLIERIRIRKNATSQKE